MTAATDADHIVALKDGGSRFDPANLQSLCHDHHKDKIAAENSVRRTGKPAKPKGCDATGTPAWWR